MYKWWIIAGVVVIGLLLVGGFAAYRMFTGPMFRPGSVVGRTDLQPAQPVPVPQNDPDAPWQVTDDVTLVHDSLGSGRHVLFVHGGPGAPPGTISPALKALAATRRVHQYDQRGAGRSTRLFDGATSDNTWSNIQALEGQLGVGQQLADIERIRRILGDDQLTIIGHSYGALLAALYAAEFPDAVDKLVLIAPADMLVFPSPHGGLFDAIRARLPERDKASYDTWLANYLDLTGSFGQTTSALEDLDDQLVTFYEAALGPMPGPKPPKGHVGVWHARAQYFSGGMRHDWRSALGTVTAPTLVVHGGQDLQSVDVAQMYAAALGDAQVVTIDDAGHFPHLTHPEPLVAHIMNLLDAP